MDIWNILSIFGMFYYNSVYFVLIWYIFPVLVSCTKKILATLVFPIKEVRKIDTRRRDFRRKGRNLCSQQSYENYLHKREEKKADKQE
jgi:hypothetical protein